MLVRFPIRTSERVIELCAEVLSLLLATDDDAHQLMQIDSLADDVRLKSKYERDAHASAIVYIWIAILINKSADSAYF